MQGRVVAHVVVIEGLGILELLSTENQTLLLWWDTLLLGNFGFDIFDGFTFLYFNRHCFSCQGLDEELHTTPGNSKDTVERRRRTEGSCGCDKGGATTGMGHAHYRQAQNRSSKLHDVAGEV